MDRWQFVMLVLGLGVVSWIIPALIFGYAFGGMFSSLSKTAGRCQ